jgi:hypothetical protein
MVSRPIGVSQAKGHHNVDRGPLNWSSRRLQASSDVAFSLLYVGLRRILGLAMSWRRCASDKDVVLRHHVRILERQLHPRVQYRPADRAILASLSRLLPRTRWRSWSPTTRCCVGIGERPSANGDGGSMQSGPGRPPMSNELAASSSGWVGRTYAGDACASRASCEGLGSASRPVQSGGSSDSAGSGLCHRAGRRGRSSCVPRPTAGWPRTSSPWTL